MLGAVGFNAAMIAAEFFVSTDEVARQFVTAHSASAAALLSVTARVIWKPHMHSPIFRRVGKQDARRVGSAAGVFFLGGVGFRSGRGPFKTKSFRRMSLERLPQP